MAILSGVIQAADLFYNIIVPGDASTSASQEAHRAAMNLMIPAMALVTPTDDVIKHLSDLVVPISGSEQRDGVEFHQHVRFREGDDLNHRAGRRIFHEGRRFFTVVFQLRVSHGLVVRHIPKVDRHFYDVLEAASRLFQSAPDLFKGYLGLVGDIV